MPQFVLPLEWQFTKARIVAIVGSGLMIVSVFLHWFAAAVPMAVIAALGIQHGIIGYPALFLALLSSGALFLVSAKLRNAVHAITGGIGAVGTIALIVIWMLEENVIPLWGVFLYSIGCIIITVCGVRGLKRPLLFP